MIKDKDFSGRLTINEHYSFERLLGVRTNNITNEKYSLESLMGITTNDNKIDAFLKNFLYTSSMEFQNNPYKLDKISNVKVTFKMLPNYKDVARYQPKIGARVTADYKEDNGEINHIDIFFNDKDFGWWVSDESSTSKTNDRAGNIVKFNIQICTLLYWLSKNYKFDKENFVIEPPIDDMTTGRIRFYDFDENKTIISGYYAFVDLFCEKDLIRLRLLEKITRFLQYPDASSDVSNTPWNSFEIMQTFKRNYGNFSQLIFKTLNNVDCLVNKGRTPDIDLRDRIHYNASNFKNFNQITSKYLNTTIAVNPFEVTDTASFHRIIDTYSQITVLESEGREIESKYILVPCYFEIFVIDCSLVDRTLYNKFKLGNKTFQDAIYYNANGKTFALIKNNIVTTTSIN